MKTIVSILVFLLLISCQSENSKSKGEANIELSNLEFAKAQVDEAAAVVDSVSIEMSNFEEPQSSVAQVSFPPPVLKEESEIKLNLERKLVYSSDVKYQVSDIKESDKQMLNQVKKSGGYITQKNENHTNGNLQIDYAIRIPANYFDSLMVNLGSDAIFTDYKNISSDDLTEEYTDNDLRLKSKKKVHERYLELLKQAKNVTEVMAVEEQIRQIQEEIDVNAGRNKTIDKQVAFSTITLTIYQKLAQSEQRELPFFTKIRMGLKEGFSKSIEWIINLISHWPLILIGLLIFYFGRKWWRKKNS